MKTNFYWILLFLLLGCNLSFGQNPMWLLDNRYINSAVSTPIPQNLPKPTTVYGQVGTINSGTATNPNPYDGYDGQKPKFAGNIQPKPDGTIDFFIVDGVIYDKAGNYIDEMIGVNGNGIPIVASGASEMLIIPFPGNQCNKYLIISTTVDDFNGPQSGQGKLPFVYVLDMNLVNQNAPSSVAGNFNGALVDLNGNFISGVAATSIESLVNLNSSLPSFSSTSANFKSANIFLATGPQQSDNTRFFFVTNWAGIYVFKINSNGSINCINNIPFLNSAAAESMQSRNELEVVQLANGNYRLATAFSAGFLQNSTGWVSQNLFSVDINSLGNSISTPKVFPIYITTVNNNQENSYFKGIEFSNDGRFLFCTHTTNTINPNRLEYYDFIIGGSALTPISTTLNCSLSMLERNSSNQIVIAHPSGLSTLNITPNANPNLSPAFSFTTLLSTTLTPNYEGLTTTVSRGLYMLPDQIDGANYSLSYNQDPICCALNNTYSKLSFTATTSATWTTTNPIQPGASILTIRDELRIPAGVNITISGITIKFAPNAKLIIENGGTLNGGRLTLTNGAKLTVDERCGSKLWQGVEVWGQTQLVQNTVTNTKQGVLIVQGNSTIEFASIGVLASRRTAEFTFNDAFNGGIVQVEIGNLLNNQRGVWMRKYNSPIGVNNKSYFTKANFLWNNDYISTNQSVQEHLRLEEVTGVIIRGSVFQNAIALATNSNFKKGRGILSMTSHFIVCEFCNNLTIPCTNATKSTFTDLDYAIRATSSNYTKSFWVYNSTFTNNRYGIHGTGITDPKITLNNFFIREDNLAQSAGVALYSSTGYTIEGNNFEEFNNTAIANGLGQSYGIVINNSGTSDNEVYRNTFSKLKVGGLSEGVNGETQDPASNYFYTKGLRWFCNTFNAPIYETDLGINGIIAYQQGYPITVSVQEAIENATRNKFSLSGESQTLYPNHDIWSTPISQQINYTHLADITHTPDNYTLLNVYVSPAEALGNPVFSTATMCPSRINHNISFANLKMAEIKTVIVAKTSQLKDGSNTNIIEQIQTMNTETSNDVYNELYAKSPYLSNDLLRAVYNSDFDSQLKFELIMANTPLNQKMKEELSSSGLENMFQQIIIENSNGENPVDQLVKSIGRLESEYKALNDRTVQEYLFDEEAFDLEQLKAYLETADDEDSKKMYYDILMAKNETEEIENLKSETVFSNNDDFIKLQDVKQELYFDKNDEETLVEDERMYNALTSLKESELENEIPKKAQAILEKVEGLYDIPDFEPLFAPLYRSANADNAMISIDSPTSPFQVYPNPANENLVVVMNDYIGINLQYEVVDIRGCKVLSQSNESNALEFNLDVANLKSGIYILKVIDNSVCVDNIKFVIKK
jgi:hypothetical protein